MNLNSIVHSISRFGLSHRKGVSLVEVLFAMMIALFGLAGVLAIFPLAARQAADSYSLNQATNGAMNAAAASAAARDICPSEPAPWVFVDDLRSYPGTTSNDPYSPPLGNCFTISNPAAGVDPYKPVKKFSDLYIGLIDKDFNYKNGAVTKARVQRQMVGQGFCYDPLYLSYVNQITWLAGGGTDYSGGIGRRTRMPYYSEFLDTTTFDGNGHYSSLATNEISPRLIRVSSLSSLNINITNPPMPLSTSSANSRVCNIGDLIPASIQVDKSFGALREFDGVDQGSLLSAGNNSDLSWFATIVPMESKSLEYPTQFTVSIVIVKKRDRIFDVPDATGAFALSASERIASVTSQVTPYGTPAISTGSLLNATLHFDARTDSTIKSGDYVMLSRYVLWNLPDTGTNGRRYVHRHAWYRVLSVGEHVDTDLGTPQLSRDVVLQGRPWDFPDVTSTSLNGTTNLPAYTEVPTVATLLENVVAVYEYPINITD